MEKVDEHPVCQFFFSQGDIFPRIGKPVADGGQMERCILSVIYIYILPHDFSLAWWRTWAQKSMNHTLLS